MEPVNAGSCMREYLDISSPLPLQACLHSRAELLSLLLLESDRPTILSSHLRPIESDLYRRAFNFYIFCLPPFSRPDISSLMIPGQERYALHSSKKKSRTFGVWDLILAWNDRPCCWGSARYPGVVHCTATAIATHSDLHQSAQPAAWPRL